MEKIFKRKDYITWDEYFMGIAILSAKRSKDPNTQVGACIVNNKNRIIGLGYNGLTAGNNDDEFLWNRDGDYLNTKYPYVCHAELNAILNSMLNSLEGTKMYVTLFPCNECAKAIIQTGISEIVYLQDKYNDLENIVASKKILKFANIKLTKFKKSNKKIEINFNM